MPNKLDYELCQEFSSVKLFNDWKTIRKATWSNANTVKVKCVQSQCMI